MLLICLCILCTEIVYMMPINRQIEANHLTFVPQTPSIHITTSPQYLHDYIFAYNQL